MTRIGKIIALLMLSGLLLSAFSACASAPAQSQALYPAYAYYTDIPGVTQAEIDAIEALKQDYDRFSLAMNHSTEAFLQDDGTIGGFSSLFCLWLSDLFGIPFEPQIAEWDALISGLGSMAFDFTGELTATPERRRIYHMTDAIAERSIKSFRLMGSESLSALSGDRPLRFAFLEGSTAEGYISDTSEHAYTSFFVRDYYEAASLLRSGEIDAFFEDGTSEAAFDRFGDIVAADYFPLIYTPVSLSTGNPQLAPIITVLQKYLDKGALYHLTTLYNAGEQAYRMHKLQVQLTDEENAYLQSFSPGQSVPVGLEFDNYPISFYNHTEQAWQGIAVDVLAEISTLTGLSFEVANAPDVFWSDLMSMLESGEVAFVSELIRSQDRVGQFLWPEEAYCTDNFALLSLSEKESIKVNQILYSSVGTVAGMAYEEVFNKWFPDHQDLTTYPSTDELFLALESGEIDFAMASRNIMLSMTNYAEKPGFKVNILFNSTYGSTFGFNKDQGVLCSVVDKALKQIDTQTLAERWIYRVFDYRAKLISNRMPYLFGLAALLIAVLVLVTVLLVRRRKSARQLEELVRQRTAELEVQTAAALQASRAKSDFLSRMSHEIRTPLNAVIGMAQVSRSIPDLPQKAVRANDEILTASRHLLGVLNDVLDMAKIESGKFALVNEPFVLGPAMDEVVELIAPRCEEKDITFHTGSPALAELSLCGDKLRLKQVLINLLGNAVKFTGTGGNIWLDIELIAQTGAEATLEFSVRDDGIGMTPEQVGRLFVAFEQADKSIAVTYGGTGLGLAISQNMVLQMGGEIKVESQAGVGSRFRFTVTLPKARQALKLEHGEAVPALPGRRILLAEDVPVNRLILAELLGGTGIQLDEAEDGQRALDMFGSAPIGHYDLIFMDVQMPRMNGYAATRAIRALDRPDAKVVPIIAMTANAYKEDIEDALQSGMNDHIAKPIDMDTIYRTLRQYLN